MGDREISARNILILLHEADWLESIKGRLP